MKTEVNPESLKAMSLKDFKVALKKDKKFLKKSKGVVFINDYQFSDKKGLAILLFKKSKEVKDCFKQMKKDGQPVAKIAAGVCEYVEGENGKELKVDIKMGGLAPDKIQLKGKSIFKSVLGLLPNFVTATETATEQPGEEATDGSIWDQIRAQVQQAAAIVENTETETVEPEQEEQIQNAFEKVRGFLQRFKNAAPEEQEQEREKAVEAKGFFDKIKSFVQNMPKREAQSESPSGELGGFFDKIRKQFEQVNKVVAKYKAEEVEEKDAEQMSEMVNSIKSWFNMYKQASDEEKKEHKEKAAQLKEKYPKVKGIFAKVQQLVQQSIENIQTEEEVPSDKAAEKEKAKNRMLEIKQRIAEIKKGMEETINELQSQPES